MALRFTEPSGDRGVARAQGDHPGRELIQSAQRRGEAEIVVDPYHSAVFFLLGVYGLLAVTIDADQGLRKESADSYLTYGTLRSLQPR